MLDTKLRKTGTLLMHDGRIYTSGFRADGCMCREVAAHALLWAIGELQRELAALIEKPGGTGNVAADMPSAAVETALGIDPWGDDEDEA
jgi:hypothetical protein